MNKILVREICSYKPNTVNWPYIKQFKTPYIDMQDTSQKHNVSRFSFMDAFCTWGGTEGSGTRSEVCC